MMPTYANAFTVHLMPLIWNEKSLHL